MALTRTVCALGVALAVATTTSVACGGGGGGYGDKTTGPNPQPTTGNAVTVSNNRFTPANLSVSPGATVTWTWDACSGGDAYGNGQSCVSHNVTFDQGPSSATQSSGTFTRAFATGGTFPYHCTIHGASMSGRVVVQ